MSMPPGKFIVTPLGIACGNCKESPPTPLWNENHCRVHVKSCWPKHERRALRAVFQGAQEEASSLSSGNILDYLTSDDPKTILYCWNCKRHWETWDGARHHCRRSSSGCTRTCLSNVFGRKSICGRWVPGLWDPISSTDSQPTTTTQPVLTPIQVDNNPMISSSHNVTAKRTNPSTGDDQKAEADANAALDLLLDNPSRCYLQSLRLSFGGESGLQECGKCPVCKPPSGLLLTTVKAPRHVPDEHEDAPLLPPNALDTSFIHESPPRIVVNHTLEQARNFYDLIKGSITQYNDSQAKFLVGSFYSEILGKNPFCVIPRMGHVININLGPDYGMVQVGLCADSSLTGAVVALSKACSHHNENTSRKGHRGKMYAMGYRNRNTGRKYKPTEDPEISRQMAKVGTGMSKYMNQYHPSVYNNSMQQAFNDEVAPLPLDEMGDGRDAFSAFFLTTDFANSSHYDCRDKSLSFRMWVEDEPGDAEDWYFVLPNVMVAGQYGLVIRLSHGVVIAWDGTKVRHCTSLCTKSDTNTVTGFMVGVQ